MTTLSYKRVSPERTGPGTCATVGCQDKANTRVAYSFPDDRGHVFEDVFCNQCAQQHCRRTSLEAYRIGWDFR